MTHTPLEIEFHALTLLAADTVIREFGEGPVNLCCLEPLENAGRLEHDVSTALTIQDGATCCVTL